MRARDIPRLKSVSYTHLDVYKRQIEGIACVLFAIRFSFEYDFAHAVYYAVFMSVSAFCNAGFDPFGFENSIVPYVDDPVVNFVVMALIILGGMGFSVILDVLHARRWGRLTLHSRIVLLMTGILILFGMLMTCLLEWNNPKTLDNGLSPAEKMCIRDRSESSRSTSRSSPIKMTATCRCFCLLYTSRCV